MNYYAAILKVKDAEKAEKYQEAHLDYVKQLCREGKIYLIGKLVREGGLIVFQADNMASVESWLMEDPFIKHGARAYDLYEWHMQTADEYLL